MLRGIFAALLVLALAVPAAAQSTAANGSIEGTVLDSSGGVLPGVTVTVTNAETGAQRVVVTNEAGLFRAPLLPLGTYKVVAELRGLQEVRGGGDQAERRADGGPQDRAGRRRPHRDGDRERGRPAGARTGAHRHRPHDERPGSAQPAARRAQPVQLRARAARRDRLSRTWSSACPAWRPTARPCASTTRSTATRTPRRTAPASACCRCPRS